jgi:16S rRNA (uracil1498-N3)-methyltransferase
MKPPPPSTGAQAEHLARVLRAQPGMEADVVAGGRVFHAEVAAVTLAAEKSEVRFNLTAELQADPALPVTLVLAVYKFDRMEWAIEKATELGVAAIAPVIARRTEKHLAQAAARSAPSAGAASRTRPRSRRGAPMCR